MATKSTFYDTAPGVGVKETQWAESAPSRGATYGVIGDALKLTAHPTTPYAVNLAPGKFFGRGVWDELDTVQRVDSVAPANGVFRWDMIAARRDWQPTGGGPTSYVSIQGGSSAGIPPTRQNHPGSVDDQPLWLVQWKGGETQPQQIIDLRCWAGPGGVEVAHKLALNYLAEPGAAVKLGSSLWRYERKSNGVWEWREYKPAELIQSGYKIVRTNPDGYCTVPYDEPFPGGTRIAVPVGMNPPAGMSLVRFVSGEKAAANFLVTATNGEPLRNVSVAIGYIATGF